MTILKIVWDSVKKVFTRLLDGVEPEYIDEIRHSLTHVKGIKEILNIKSRWSGHQLLAEIYIRIESKQSVIEAHNIIEEVEHEIMNHIKYVSNVIVDIEPENTH